MTQHRLNIGGRHFHLPRSRRGRITLGIGFVIGGVFGFLPILGFWMIPVGFLILSTDVPWVRRRRRLFVVRWTRWRRSRAS